MLLKKGSKQTPSPKDVTGMLPALPRVRYAKNNTELGWLQGRQKGSKERKWEGKAVQDKERTPRKANWLLLFLLFFTFPKPHNLSSKYLLTQCDLYKVGYIPPHIQRICNSTKRWLDQTTHFDLVWVPALLFSVTTHFRANTVSLSKGPASSVSPNSVWHSAQYKVFSKHMQLSLLATGDVPLTAFSPH